MPVFPCKSLVYTYEVCERLSVMHELAGVVEILFPILQNTPYSVATTEYPPEMKIFPESKNQSPRIPPSPKMKMFQNWMETSKLKSPRIPPPSAPMEKFQNRMETSKMKSPRIPSPQMESSRIGWRPQN